MTAELNLRNNFVDYEDSNIVGQYYIKITYLFFMKLNWADVEQVYCVFISSITFLHI